MRAEKSKMRLVALGAVELGIAGGVGAIIGTIGGLFLGPALGYLESRILKAAS